MIETCAYGTRKVLVSKKEEINCSNIIKQYKKVDDVIKEHIKEHNPNLPQIPDHSQRILIIADSGYGKTNSDIITQILIKLIYALKIHMKHNVDFYIINKKIQA